jgi:hypothetical protein
MPKVEFGPWLNGIAGLGLGAAAAYLSKTIVKDQLVPDQIGWLGAAGCVTAGCILVIVYAHLRITSKKVIKLLSACLVLALVIVLVLRTAFVYDVSYENQTHHYLVGWRLTDYGKIARAKLAGGPDRADSLPPESLIKLAGPDKIPQLYGASYSLNQFLYMFAYLGLLACFSLLVGAIELHKDARASAQPA